MRSLIKLKSYYYLQFYVASRTPSRKRVPLRTRTKTTAVKLQRKLVDEYVLGEFDPWVDNHITDEEENSLTKDSLITEVMKAFIAFKKQKDWRGRTGRNTPYVLNSFVRYLASDLSIGQLRISDFNIYLNKTDIKYETKRSYKKTLKTFLIWLNDEKLNVLDKKKFIIYNRSDEQEENVNYFTKEDIQTLTNYIREIVTADRKKGFQHENNNALWLIDFIHWQRLSGMRLSETLNLRAGDINQQTWEVTVGNDHFVTKSKKSRSSLLKAWSR